MALQPIAGSSTEPLTTIRDRWALLVGVNRYIEPNFPSLKFCVKDVLALEVTLKELGYRVICMHDELNHEDPRFPTRDNIEAELTQLCQAVGADDLLLMHFACHGMLVNGQPVLITHEIRDSTKEKKALPLTEVEKQMRSCKARRLVLTLDACHTGVEIGRGVVAEPEFIRNAYELAEGFALIAASTAQQLAQEWQEKEHGVFTYYLLEGLSGQADRNKKGFVTVNDLQTHVLNSLRRWNVQHGRLIQEPTARAEGLGDMILADYRGRLGSPRTPDTEIQPNPFGDTGRISDPKSFFGREELLRQLFEELGRGSNRSLVGQAQVGKSSILLIIRKLGPERLHLPQEAFIYLDMRNVYNEQEFFEALCYELGIEPWCRGWKLGRALGDKRYIVCLDEIDNMAKKERFTGDERTELCGLADGADMPLTLVIASQKSLKDLFPDSPLRTSPLADICQQIDVEPFLPNEARRFLKYRLEGTGVNFSENQINELLAKSGCHPGRLQRAAAELYHRHVVAPEQTILRRIIRQWSEPIIEEGGEVGQVKVIEPVANPYVVGNPVTDNLFVGREDILRRLEELWMVRGQRPSVLLYGNLRMGKTSILRNLNTRLGSQTTVVDFNMQRIGQVANTGELLYNLSFALYNGTSPAQQEKLGEPNQERFLAHNPYSALDRFLKQLDRVRAGQRFIVAIDQFELIEDQIVEKRLEPNLLGFWRSLIHTYPWLVMAFAGLHTLQEMTQDYWNPLFGSVMRIHVSFLSDEAAKRLITQPSPDFNLDYDPDAVKQIIKLTNGQPYLVQLIGHTLVTHFNRQTFEEGIERERRFTVEDVEAVLNAPEFYRDGNAYFNGVWVQAEKTKPAGQITILEALSYTTGLSLAEIANKTALSHSQVQPALETLESHDVVKQHDGEYVYTVELMRRWVAQRTGGQQ